MPKNDNRPPYLSVLFVTATAIALAACSSSGPASTSAPGSSTASAPAPSTVSATGTSSAPSPTPVITGTSPSVAGQFTNLPDGSKVIWQQRVSGVVRSLPPGTDAWIIVVPQLAPAYWPQKGPLSLGTAGGFVAFVQFGQSATQSIGEQFIVQLVIVSQAASERFRTFVDQPVPSVGLSALPHGVQTVATITVTRR